MALTYQDQWVRGHVRAKGYRDCASRYEVVKAFCARFVGPFTVCDIGANNCYFGLRLIEDYPLCSVIAFEYNQFEKRAALVRANGTSRLVLLRRKVSLADVDVLSACAHFDVVLVLSTLHHLGGSCDAWLASLRRLGRHVLAEFAVADSRSRRVPARYGVPADAVNLGHFPSHIRRGVRRPFVMIPGTP